MRHVCGSVVYPNTCVEKLYIFCLLVRLQSSLNRWSRKDYASVADRRETGLCDRKDFSPEPATVRDNTGKIYCCQKCSLGSDISPETTGMPKTE